MEFEQLYKLWDLNNKDKLTQEESMLQHKLKAVIYNCDDPIAREAMILRFDVSKGTVARYWYQIGMDMGTNGDCLRVIVNRYLKGIPDVTEL